MTEGMKCNGCMPSCVGKCLVYVGALNWGLVGLGGFLGGDWNLVHMLLGSWPMVEWAVYVLVGVAAVISIVGCKCAKCKAACQTSGAAPM